MRRLRQRPPADAQPPTAERSRKPRLMIAGEFSAGKTRLLNGLLGERVLPSNVTSTALPPVWMVRGAPAGLAVGLDGASRRIDTLAEAGVDDTHYCVLCHPAPLLDRFELIDTPGNSDPNIPSESWERMLDYADALVWCTNATQAWRQSEKSVWRDMPDRLRDKATLIATHADRLPDETATNRVLRRLNREAGEIFPTILMASLEDAADIERIRAHLDGLTRTLDPLQGAECRIPSDFANARPAMAAPTGARAAAPSRAERPEGAEPAQPRAMAGFRTRRLRRTPHQKRPLPTTP